MASEIRALFPKIKLPTGKTITLLDALKLCYDISETDALVLLELLKGREYDVATLAERLKLSKATVNRSLNKLVEIGLAVKKREKRRGVGRPKYKYSVENPQGILTKIKNALVACTETISRYAEEMVSHMASTSTQ